MVYLPLGPWGRVIGLPLRRWVLCSLEQGDARNTEAVTQGRRGQVPRRGRRAHPPDHLHPNILSLLSALSSHGALHTQHAVRAIPFAQQVPQCPFHQGSLCPLCSQLYLLQKHGYLSHLLCRSRTGCVIERTPGEGGERNMFQAF